MPFDCIVVASHLRFDGVWQRPHHIVTRLAERVPVLFVEEPFLAERDADAVTVHGNVTVVRPERTNLTARMFDARALATVATWLAGRTPLLWLYTPLAEPLANAYQTSEIAYDRMDDLASFAFAPAGLAERESALLSRAQTIFAGGRSLFEQSKHFGSKVRLEPSGVEFEHFARAEHIAPHELFAHLSGPVCGYAGVIDERIDFTLLEALATRPVEIVLIGPVTKIDGALLPRRTNVHCTGHVAYAALPSFLAGFDVALLPFARNAATATISPTKTPEYLAAQKPVVSTRVADVVATFGDVAYFADAPEAFADACLAALERDPDRRQRGLALARAASWDAIAARMWSAVKGE